MIVVLIAVWLVASEAIADDDSVTANQTVDALEGVYGVHPGQRRNHTKGTCALGEFVGNPRRRSVFAVRACSPARRCRLWRVSLSPAAIQRRPIRERSPRGMALEFGLPDGRLAAHDHARHADVLRRHARTFLDKMMALKPDPATGKPDPEKVKDFLASHPDNRGQAKFLADHNPPASYANSAYYGIHTFKFINRDNKTTLVRWRFVPQDGEKRLSDAELKSMPADFLEQALIQRDNEGGPVRWDMIVDDRQARRPGGQSDAPMARRSQGAEGWGR